MKRGCLVVLLIVFAVSNLLAWGVRIAQPLDGSISTIPSMGIMYQFERAESVDVSSITFAINTQRYEVTDPELEWEPSHLTFSNPHPFTEGVYACTLYVDNIAGEPVENSPLATTFTIDLHGPHIVAYEPTDYDTLGNPIPILTTDTHLPITFYFTDDYGIINPSTVSLLIEGVIYPVGVSPALTWDYPYPYETASGDTIMVARVHFDPEVAGVTWNEMDTVNARLYTAQDMPYYGDPNRLQIQPENRFFFYVDAKPPSAEILHPLTEDARATWTSCRDQDMSLRVWDEYGILPSSIEVEIEGITYDIYDDPVSFDTLTGIFTYSPVHPYSNGDTVDISLVSATDVHGNEILPEECPSWNFIIDRSSPFITGHYPPDGYLTTNDQEHIWFTIEDTIGIVDPSSIELIIEFSSGERWEYTGVGLIPGVLPEISWDGEKYEFIPEMVDSHYTPGDTVYVTVQDAADSSRFCGANHITETYFWSFYVAGGPKAEIVHPKDGEASSCEMQEILLYLHDEDFIDPNSVLLKVENKVYGIDSSFTFVDTIWVGGTIVAIDTTVYYPLSVTDTTVLFTPPPDFYHDGQQVDVVLLEATDTYGNPVEGLPLAWHYMMDFTSPFVDFTIPADDGRGMGPSPFITIAMFDSLSGKINPNTIVLRVGNIYYRIADAALTSDSVNIFFDGEEAGVTYEDGEEVEVCLEEVYDGPENTCGPSNFLRDAPYCFSFTVDNTPPVIEVLEPTPEGFTACPTQPIRIFLDDPAGIDPESIVMIVQGNLYDMESEQLELVGDTLVFTPSEAYSEGLVNFSLVSIADGVGNYVGGSPLNSWFTVDLTPPEILTTYPEDGEVLPGGIDWISAVVYDELSDFDLTTASFEIMYTEPETTIYEFTYEDSVIFYDDEAGDVWLDLEAAGLDLVYSGLEITVTFRIADAPDNACDEPNYVEYTWTFTFSSGWEVTLAIDEEYSLIFGARIDASEAYDPDVDVLSPPFPPDEARPIFTLDEETQLVTDYRQLGEESYSWIIYTGDETGTLTWDPASIPTHGSFLINGEDMRTMGSFDFSADELIEIAYNLELMHLSMGWNLVSLPVVPDDPSVENIFPEPTNVWAYSAARRRYYNPTVIEPGHAYFVLSIIDTSYSVPGAPVDTYDRRLSQGWNLIGSVYNFAGVPLESADVYPTGSIMGPIAYSYNTATGAYDATSNIVAGLGYWVLVTLPFGHSYCDFSLDAGLARSVPRFSIEPERKAELMITDGNREVTLTVGEDNSATSQFDFEYDELLPPSVVDATFDAYLGSEPVRLSRSVRNDGVWTINVDSKAPVTLSVITSDLELLIDGELLDGSVTLNSGTHTLKLAGGKRGLPSTYALYQNLPNPFNAATAIKFDLPEDTRATLSIYDMLGRKIRMLVSSELSAGTHTVIWDGCDNAGNVLPTGVYFYRLTAGDFSAVKKLTLMK